MRWILILTVFLTVTTSTLQAIILYVPDDFTTIQGAIVASKSCDTIIVRAGEYAENVDFLGKAITLTSDEGPYYTKIHPVGGIPVQCISGEGPATVLDGFTVMDGPDGMYIEQSSPMVMNCHFLHSSGAGMRNNQSNPTVTNCRFESCDRGGMANTGSSPTVTDCVFDFNWNMNNYGGGMINKSGSNPVIFNSIFYWNSGWGGGNGMYNDTSNPTVINCTFAKNMGGGPVMYNYNSHPTVTNSILWNSDGIEIYNYNSTTVVTYSDIYGGYPGTGNIDSDPLFVDPQIDDYHLTYASPCIDAGDNYAPSLPSTDFEGDPRIFPGNGKGYLVGAPPQPAIVDMGVDEYCLLKRLQVLPK